MSGARPGPGRRALLRAASLGGVVAAAPALAAPAIAPELREALRRGGCVLLVRHAITDPGVGDPPGFRLADCSTQRNLSAAGREQARRLGDALRSIGAPLGEVRSSRWCRCLDTARIAFGRVEPWPPLDSFFEDGSDRDARTAAVRDWALAARGPSNAVAVTHQVNATALAGGWLGMGETLVLAPRDGALAQLGRFSV
ncbi:MAG TPA: histidine phosphatase family protein [Burkholderiaceae bacterium]|nr:histidine phosphatase family protein [Burkholderiaceae bacterium]